MSNFMRFPEVVVLASEIQAVRPSLKGMTNIITKSGNGFTVSGEVEDVFAMWKAALPCPPQ